MEHSHSWENVETGRSLVWHWHNWTRYLTNNFSQLKEIFQSKVLLKTINKVFPEICYSHPCLWQLFVKNLTNKCNKFSRLWTFQQKVLIVCLKSAKQVSQLFTIVNISTKSKFSPPSRAIRSFVKHNILSFARLHIKLGEYNVMSLVFLLYTCKKNWGDIRW